MKATVTVETETGFGWKLDVDVDNVLQALQEALDLLEEDVKRGLA